MVSENLKITVNGISKRFGETVALKNCSINIKPGQVHAIVGENGSGKSTLAKIISGVIIPDEGSLLIYGKQPINPIQAKKMGIQMIFQEVLVAESLPVVDNIFLGNGGLWKPKISRKIAKKKAKDLLKDFSGIEINPDTLVKNLPLSVRQWIVILRALVTKPKILILDESSAALDLDATARLHKEIIKMKNNGCSILLVTHRIAELIKISDYATVLRDGYVVGELSKEKINSKNLMNLISPKNTHQLNNKNNELKKPSDTIVLQTHNLVINKNSKPLDFNLKSGEILGVTGLDGQGQASFIRMLAGIESPLRGKIYSGSEKTIIKNIFDAQKNGLAYISGDRSNEGIFPNLSIFENFSLALYRNFFGHFGWIKHKPLKRAFEKEKNKLSIRMGKYSNKITSLSGGNQQKVLISRVLANKPRIIVLDDPARGVDATTKRELYIQFKNFVYEGGSIIYLSSEIEEFFNFAHRVLIFRNGYPFSSISSENLSEKAMLSAMFGQSDLIEINFEKNLI
jgi:ABC-type sugar transport system ATPase subunit